MDYIQIIHMEFTFNFNLIFYVRQNLLELTVKKITNNFLFNER